MVTETKTKKPTAKEKRQSLGRVCAEEDCTAIIDNYNQTGFCKRHFKRKRSSEYMILPTLPEHLSVRDPLTDFLRVEKSSHSLNYDQLRVLESLLDKFILHHKDGHCYVCENLRQIAVRIIQEHPNR